MHDSGLRRMGLIQWVTGRHGRCMVLGVMRTHANQPELHPMPSNRHEAPFRRIGDRAMHDETKRPTIVVSRTPGGLLFDVDGVGTMVLDAERLTPELQARALLHGLEQKVRDAAAIGYKQPDGTFKRPTAKQKYDAMRTVIETLYNGDWNARREGTSDGGLLFEALCRLYVGKKTPEEIRTWLESKDDKTKANLRRSPKVGPIIDAIRAERNPDAVTAAEDVLDELAD